MKIKKYEIIKHLNDEFRVIDKLKDDFVCIPLTSRSKEDLKKIMGEAMNELIDSDLVNPEYITT